MFAENVISRLIDPWRSAVWPVRHFSTVFI